MKTIQYIFNLKLKPEQIYDFRGAIIHYAGAENHLFHNRNYDNGNWGKPIERYPKIQYRSIKGYAAIWAMDEGIEALQKLMNKDGNIPDFELYGIAAPLYKIEKDTDSLLPQYTDVWHYYTLHHFIPLNTETYKTYKALETFKEKAAYLEKKIVDEILLFSYAVEDWQLQPGQPVKVEITDILSITKALLRTKGDDGQLLKMRPISFQLQLRCNLLLPEGISLGRHKAYGYGVLHGLSES